MAERKRIALIFKVDPNWMGGTYYVLNIINALNTLSEEKKPIILLLCQNDDDYKFAKKTTKYPYLQFYQINLKKLGLLKRIFNKLYKSIIGKPFPLFVPNLKTQADIVFPMRITSQIRTNSPKLYWIPDFQDKFLPHFFSQKEIDFRNQTAKDIVKENGKVVFSSQDALNSFLKFYPEGKKLDTSIYHFSVSIPKLDNIDKDSILKKYRISKPYFYCANQFWVHKNHKVLFEAVNLLKKKGINILVVCSGGTKDYRNPNYFNDLTNFIKENNLENYIRILGFIDRDDQLALMGECEAIIQPSLFEGWSTAVEEAKALNKFLILSDLDLHREQAPINSLFFERSSSESLANTIETFIKDKPTIMPFDYNEHIKNCGEQIYNILINHQ